MTIKIFECTLLDAMYEEDDYTALMKITIEGSGESSFEVWDGLEWRDTTIGFNRVYDNPNSQYEYDDFIKRVIQLEESKILYEIVEQLKLDQSYYFENERIYIYLESEDCFEE